MIDESEDASGEGLLQVVGVDEEAELKDADAASQASPVADTESTDLTETQKDLVRFKSVPPS